MEELINELEKKQSEISSDIESAIADEIELDFQNEDFADGYEKGFWQGIEKAIEIVKENENLFKVDVYNKNKYAIMNRIDSAFLEIQDKKNTHNALDMIQEIKDYLLTTYRIN